MAWPNLLGILLRWAWASPTLAWLHCKVRVFVGLLQPYTVKLKLVHLNIFEAWMDYSVCKDYSQSAVSVTWSEDDWQGGNIGVVCTVTDLQQQAACSSLKSWTVVEVLQAKMVISHIGIKFSKLWPHHNFSAPPSPDNWMCKTSFMVILVHRNLSLNFSSLAISCVWQPLTLDNFHMQSTLHWKNVNGICIEWMLISRWWQVYLHTTVA